MKLNRLQLAWKMFTMQQGLQPIDEDQILAIIAADEVKTALNISRIVLSSLTFLFFTIFCQGG